MTYTDSKGHAKNKYYIHQISVSYQLSVLVWTYLLCKVLLLCDLISSYRVSTCLYSKFQGLLGKLQSYILKRTTDEIFGCIMLRFIPQILVSHHFTNLILLHTQTLTTPESSAPPSAEYMACAAGSVGPPISSCYVTYSIWEDTDATSVRF